jgi:toxin ParE1/3/4
MTIAERFGNDVALKKLEEIQTQIDALRSNPFLGTDPRYLTLKRQGYKVLILEKDLIFYKIREKEKQVVIYAVVDQRQDYLAIIRGI